MFCTSCIIFSFQVVSYGMRGSDGVRGLLKGKKVKDIDAARDVLLQALKNHRV